MNPVISKLKELAYSESGGQTLSFRLPAEDKQAFIEMCDEHNLSIGRVMRLLVKELLEEGGIKK